MRCAEKKEYERRREETIETTRKETGRFDSKARLIVHTVPKGTR